MFYNVQSVRARIPKCKSFGLVPFCLANVLEPLGSADSSRFPGRFRFGKNSSGIMLSFDFIAYLVGMVIPRAGRLVAA
jgi:hypothetical protein